MMPPNSESKSAKQFVSALLCARKQKEKNLRIQLEKIAFSAMRETDLMLNKNGSFAAELRASCSGNVQHLYYVAGALYRAGLYRHCFEVIRKPPKFCSSTHLNLHAQVAVQLGQTNDAADIWTRALAVDPEYIPAINGLLSLYTKSGNSSMVTIMSERLKAAQESLEPTILDLCGLIVFEPWAPLKRFGRERDGGYLVMDQNGGYDCFLSGGIGKYVEFEESICNTFDIECHAFDPTVDELPSTHNRIHFRKKGIGGNNSGDATNLSDYLQAHKNVFVKMDIEGFEYNWIESLNDRCIDNIKQIVMEWHGPSTKRRLACISRLARRHALVHIHPNNVHQSFRTIAGVDIPLTFETTFVRKEDARTLIPNSRPLPHELDRPNILKKPELKLDWWPFVAAYRHSQDRYGVYAATDETELTRLSEITKVASVVEQTQNTENMNSSFSSDKMALPVPSKNIPAELLDRYSLGGTVPIRYHYFNQTKMNPVKLTLERYKTVSEALEAGTFRYYGDTLDFLLAAAADHSLAHLSVCVFGSVNVNCDAIALYSGAKEVSILEYNVPLSEHPRVCGMRISDALESNLKWDAALSISSFEHDGLGRYGDPLNPEGDLRAMKEAQRMLKQAGLLFLAVPIGPDCLVWNAHRVYGPKRLPMLLEGWTVLKSYGYSESLFDLPVGAYKQPVFVLKKERIPMQGLGNS